MRLAAIVIVSLGCSPDRLRAGGADEVAWVAVLERAEGGLESRSGLRRWEGAAISVTTERDAVLVGFGEAQLAPYSIDESRIVEAHGCSPRLPSPIWAASWTEDELVEVAAETVPALSASFVESACPDPSSLALFIDPSCEDRWCATQVFPRSPCLLEADLGCALGTIGASIDPAGELCLDFSNTAWSCESVEPGPGASAAHRCSAPEACTFTAYAGATDPPPPFQLESHQLFEASPWTHPYLAARDYLSPRMTRAGYAYDLALLGDRAVISANDAGPDESCPSGGLRGRRLHHVELETFSPLGTSTAPPCLDELAPDPIGGGFIGAFEANGAWRIGRFDREGRLRSSSPASPAFGEYKVFGIEAPDPGTIAVLFTAAEPLVSGPIKSVLLLYDVALAPLATIEYSDGARVAMTVAEEGVLAIASSDPRRVHGFSVAARADAWSAGIEGELPFWHAFFDAAPGRREGDVLVTGSFASSIYSVTSRGSEVTRSDLYPLDAVPLTVSRWGLDPELFLAALIEVGRDASWLALFDVAARAFRPSVWKVGHGPVRRIEVDPSGRAWLLLPWSATLLRLTPQR